MQPRQYPDVPDDFGHWLAGFVDGEGSFLIARTHRGTYRPYLTLRLRDDDQPVLAMIRERTGIGSLLTAPGREGRSRPQALWMVQSKSDAVRLVEIFDAHPLRAKKARDYAVWREAVLYWQRLKQNHRAPRGTTLDWGPMPALHRQIKEVRAYAAPSEA